ncbi:MAG: CGNR zinc finger domain-containing protein [Anaerolineae bacterium]|nr:CGNR zinc finger domain-containing protein [Anaerolineae bacterium]
MNNNESPRFKFVGGWLCLDFVDTQNWDSREEKYERFHTYADFVWWNQQAGTLSEADTTRLLQAAEERPAAASAVFSRGTMLRETVYQVFSAISAGAIPKEADLAALNEAIVEAAAHAHLVPAADRRFQWAWVNQTDSLNQVFWPVARSAADLLTSDQLARVKQCAGDSCGWLFLDTSRNRSRRWCEMSHCGNRAKARRYYRRTRATSREPE